MESKVSRPMYDRAALRRSDLLKNFNIGLSKSADGDLEGSSHRKPSKLSEPKSIELPSTSPSSSSENSDQAASSKPLSSSTSSETEEKVPDWAISLLKEAEDQRKSYEERAAKYKTELALHKEGVEKWKQNIVAKFDEEKNFYKRQQYQLLLQNEQWHKEQERVHKEKETSIEKNKTIVKEVVEELKHWRSIQSEQVQEIMRVKDSIRTEQDKEIKSLRDRLQLLEGFGRNAIQEERKLRRTKRNSVNSPLNQFHPYPDATMSKIPDNLTKNLSSNVRKSVENFQVELAELIITRERYSFVISEAEHARKNIQVIERELLMKRKDLADLLKDIKIQTIVRSKEEMKLEQLENRLSIVRDPKKRSQLISAVPKTNFVRCALAEESQLSGPEADGRIQHFKEYVAAKGTSLYPMNHATNTKDGDPIADRYNVSVFDNAVFFAFADGCGWGEFSREAAVVASNEFVNYMKDAKGELNNSHTAAKLMLRAFLSSHNAITKGKTEETMYRAGTTTLLAGATLELEEPVKVDGCSCKWMLIYVALGDCRIFSWNYKNAEIKNLSEGNKQSNDVKDPGGRLGPYLENAQPDLRNLCVRYAYCSTDDVLFVLSDGVGDNLDPYFCGETPQSLGLECESGFNDWDKVKNKEDARLVREMYSVNLLKELLGHSSFYNPSPLHITRKLIGHAVKITQPSRDFMEKENKAVPNEPTIYTGKMDHAACLAFRIGYKANGRSQRKFTL
eukprot:TRINITY_DN2295_c1_g1_i2.p1 TRINITY_DN2295_c1_g1~~TRINITY_DN2295_c1_g1_i2.p1  ORF type:complete len:743 (+),score=196.84 TRINITY_DN2295_c1_g1_i2:30-2231(+)